MYGQLRRDIQEIIRTLCRYQKADTVSGSASRDHIRLCVRIPPEMSVSYFMGYLKGKSALMISGRHPEYKKKGEKRNFWAGGYYAGTIGRDGEQIKKYTAEQTDADRIEEK
jgi:putative transposase